MRSSIEVVLGDVFQHADDGQSSEIRAQIDRLTRLVQEARAPRDTTSMDTAFMLGQLWTGFGSGSYVGGFSAPGGRPSVSQATRAAANDDALAMTGSMSPNVNVSAPRGGGGGGGGGGTGLHNGNGAAGQDQNVHATLTYTSRHCPPLAHGSVSFTCNCAHGRHGLGCILDLENGLDSYFQEQRQDALNTAEHDRDSVSATCTLTMSHPPPQCF